MFLARQQQQKSLRGQIASSKKKLQQARFHRHQAQESKKKANMLIHMYLSTMLRTRTIAAKPRYCNFFEEDVRRMDDQEFKNNFRLSRATFVFLCRALQKMEKNITFFKMPIPLQKRIAISLYVLGKLNL